MNSELDLYDFFAWLALYGICASLALCRMEGEEAHKKEILDKWPLSCCLFIPCFPHLMLLTILLAGKSLVGIGGRAEHAICRGVVGERAFDATAGLSEALCQLGVSLHLPELWLGGLSAGP